MTREFGRFTSLPAKRIRLPFLIFVLAAVVTWNVLLATVMVFLEMNDFGKFYYSARFFLDGADMYGPSPATWLKIDATNRMHFWNMNPPHVHLVLLPLARLAPHTALGIWMAASLLCLLASVVSVADELDLRLSIEQWLWVTAALLAFAGTGAVMITGQLSFMLLLLVTRAWIAARRGSWMRAGSYLGIALAIKPFFLIFLPYFIIWRRWRAMFSFAAVASGCFVVGFVIFGAGAYRRWIEVLSSVQWTWASMNGSLCGFLDRLLDVSPHFRPATQAPSLVGPLWAVGSLAVAVGTLATSSVSRAATIDRSFASLLLASQLISPLGWIYYVCLALPPLISSFVGFVRAAGAGALSRRAIDVLGLATLCLIVPVPALIALQPSAVATVLHGSAYFWGTLLLWWLSTAELTSTRLSPLSEPVARRRRF